MTAASSIWRIRLSCSTTGPTSNWKALAIAVLLRLGDFLISRRLNITGFRPQRVSGLGSTHVPLGEEPESCKRCRAGPAPVWNNCETETGDLAEIEALFFAPIGGSPGRDLTRCVHTARSANQVPATLHRSGGNPGQRQGRTYRDAFLFPGRFSGSTFGCECRRDAANATVAST